MGAKKIFFLSVICASALLANEKVEIVAKKVEHTDDIVTAVGDAVATGDGYYIKADKLVYDKKNSTIEGYGDIFILKDSSMQILSDYVTFNTEGRTGFFDKFFMQNTADDVWVSSKKGDVKGKVYSTNSSVSSSCNPTNPDWRLEYTSSEYNTDSKVMALNNATLYLGSVPILYSPYFSFSTDKTRRSGLLKPDIGLKGNEGFIYMQPIYFVTDPDSSWDSETNPQIRTKRGKGINQTFRFMDSPYSRGYVKGGYFSDEKSFKEIYSLKYGSHYGFSVFYDREKVFTDKFSKDSEDGFYVDINYLNDIDYVNLKNRDNFRDNVVDKITTSKINYFYQKQNNYFGVYGKYYIDTSKTSNDDTIQEYPKFHYHHNTDNLWLNNLLFSADAKSARFDRRSGINALQNEIAAPITYTDRFFDDLLGVKISENLYANKVSFSNISNGELKDYSFYSATHKAGLFTDLIRPYEDFTHYLNLEYIYTIPGTKSEKNYPGFQDELISLVTSSSESENSAFKLSQFFYDTKGSLVLIHRLNQYIYHDDSRVGYRYSDTENEIAYYPTKDFSVVTDVFYSNDYSRISASTTSLKYDDKETVVSLSHVYKNKATLLGNDKGNYYTLSGSQKLGYLYDVFGTYEYDEAAKETRAWSIGASMTKKCINYAVKIKNENTPILTSTSSSSIKNYIIYFSINLIPLGGVNQAYSISTSK